MVQVQSLVARMLDMCEDAGWESYAKMRQRPLLVMLLVGVIVTITPLAHAELPDQIWIRGIYDGGDEDEALVQIQTMLDATEPPPLYFESAAAPCIDPLLAPYEKVPPVYSSSLDPSRGPPTS